MELKQLAEAARERAGDVLGALAAPAVALVAQVRRARMFHPEGVTFVGRSVAVDGPMRELGDTLAGRVLARGRP